ncbi:transposase IS4 family protein [Paenibacillus dendritiformis C454]|uniref:Transposase IS4 family protein n=1 Tax=Paenibacillus dendritiformis C454 TaxID=1131935 RepID=H3SJ70_9BACL|nr:transposase IS4 family protein [Paenibacillus dendritiformis C454]
MLTIGWSDGHNFLPLDFALLSSRNGQINGMNEKIDKRTIRNEWLALLTTYLTLTVEEVIRIYAVHWDIEVFFKFTTSLLRLQKEFQGRS